MAINFWKLGSDLSWKDAASSTEVVHKESHKAVLTIYVNEIKKFKIKIKNKKSNICVIYTTH